ncbi:MAG: hypothetical protein EHM45_04410 [Desulfobacteraceae bacterium]|nr:MAG: hypothetical protein EHM45_04410 [Desulfobacteraceae bacterium]
MKDAAYFTAIDRDLDERFLGAKLLSVNGRPMEEIKKILGSLASCENDVCRMQKAAGYMTSPLILAFMGVGENHDSLRVRVMTRQGNEETIMIPVKKAEAVQWRETALKAHPITHEREDWFWHQILPDKHLCYMQFNSFQDRQTERFMRNARGSKRGASLQNIDTLPDFKEFLERMFGDMRKEKVRTLVIDLRYNGGGNSALGDQIMYYLELVPNTLIEYRSVSKLFKLCRDRYPQWFSMIEQQYQSPHGKNAMTLPCFYNGTTIQDQLTPIADRQISMKRFFSWHRRSKIVFLYQPSHQAFLR